MGCGASSPAPVASSPELKELRDAVNNMSKTIEALNKKIDGNTLTQQHSHQQQQQSQESKAAPTTASTAGAIAAAGVARKQSNYVKAAALKLSSPGDDEKGTSYALSPLIADTNVPRCTRKTKIVATLGKQSFQFTFFSPLYLILSFQLISFAYGCFHTRVLLRSTAGPKSNKLDTLPQLIEAGADVLRLNFSHADGKAMDPVIDVIRKVRADLEPKGIFVSVLADLQGRCGPSEREAR